MNKVNPKRYISSSNIPSRINRIATAPINNPIILEIACDPSLPKNFYNPDPRRMLYQQIKIDKIITKNFKNNPFITKT